MKSSILTTAIAALMLLVGSQSVKAYEKDSDGYPVFYLHHADMTLDDGTRFTRTDANNYTLHVDNLLGEFRIGDRALEIVYGSTTDELQLVRAGEDVNAVKGAGLRAFRAVGLKDVTITFQYWSRTTTTIHVEGTPTVPASMTLPIVHVDVRNEDGTYNDEVTLYNLGHKEYFQATYYVENAGGLNLGTPDKPLATQIKARGNYTRQKYIKKPFKLKLDKKQSMLGLSKSKHFALLAHADDSVAFLHNYVAFNLGERLELPWTPHVQPCELVLNGDYRGIYFLTESIRVEKDRVDIEELNDLEEDPTLVSGGYVVEFDNYTEENQIVMDEKSCVAGDGKRQLRITYTSPEVYSDIQRRFVYDQFTAMNDAVGANSDNLWRYLDLDDAARYYVACEIAGHTEAFGGSTYLHRDRGEGQKWHFGPLWDFGHALEAPLYSHIERSGPYGQSWVKSLKTNNKFRQKVFATFKWVMSKDFNSIYTEMEDYVKSIEKAVMADNARWANTEKPNWPNALTVRCNPDMWNDLAQACGYIYQRTEWLKTVYGKYTAETTEPVRDTTEAAPLPEYIESGVMDVVVDDSRDLYAPAEYFTIDGRHVTNPLPGHLYILRRGNTVTKVIL